MYYVIKPADDIIHSRGPWKKHKYISNKDGNYVYPRDSYAKTGRRYGYAPSSGNDEMQKIQNKVLKKNIKEDKRHNKIAKRINRNYRYDTLTVLGDNNKSLLGNSLKKKFRAYRETKRHERNQRKIAKYANKSMKSLSGEKVKKGKGLIARLLGGH